MKKSLIILAMLLVVATVYAQPVLSSYAYGGVSMVQSNALTTDAADSLQFDSVKTGIGLDFTYKFDFGLFAGANVVAAIGVGNFVVLSDFGSLSSEVTPLFTGDFRVGPVIGYEYNPGGKRPSFPQFILTPVFFGNDFGLGRIAEYSSTYMGTSIDFAWITTKGKKVAGAGVFLGVDIFWQEMLTSEYQGYTSKGETDYLGVDVKVGYRFTRVFK